jgi:hypothetical protein
MHEIAGHGDTKTTSTSLKPPNLELADESKRAMQDDASKEGNNASTAIGRLPMKKQTKSSPGRTKWKEAATTPPTRNAMLVKMQSLSAR